MIPTLLIFAKPPRMGSAKTRLAKDIGPTHAQRLNRFCHSRIMRAAKSGHWNVVIQISPDIAINSHHENLWPASFARAPQGHGDLGQRLARAFFNAPPGPVIVVGTDTPDVTSHHIHSAFNFLNGHDVVFGPADDGGFWLFGISHQMRRHPLTFSPVRWSSEHAMSDLQKTLPEKTKTKLINTLVDLDDLSALRKWKADRNK